MHGLLLIYGPTQKEAAQLASHFRHQGSGWKLQPLPEPRVLGDPPPFREHFGFVDGIGDPVIQGTAGHLPSAPAHNVIAPGEFVLGDRTSGSLPGEPPSGSGRPGGQLRNGDLGRNGSYLVVWQLEQHAIAFWRYLLDQCGDEEEAIHLAAKMVGRWRNGAPLATWTAAQPNSDKNMDDDFLYATDPHGYGCPLGAHIRRVNPRDGSFDLEPEKSIEMSKRRRLLRRGRTYGAPVPGWPEPQEMVKHAEDHGRGLHFLCFNANIETQFEFVQQTWMISRKFGDMSNDADPMLSNPDHPERMGPSDFTIQQDPVNCPAEGRCLPSSPYAVGDTSSCPAGRRCCPSPDSGRRSSRERGFGRRTRPKPPDRTIFGRWRPEVESQPEPRRRGSRRSCVIMPRMTVRAWILASLLVVPVPAAIGQPFQVGGHPGVDPDAFEVTTFAAGLDFPFGLAVLQDGSLLVGINPPPPGGSYFSAMGRLVRFADTTGDGVADGAGSVLYTGLPGFTTSVRLAGDLVFVATGAPNPRNIFVLRQGATPASPLSLEGSLSVTYPALWSHSTINLAVRRTPGQPGPTTSSSTSARSRTTSEQRPSPSAAWSAGSLNGDSIYRVIVDDAGRRSRPSASSRSPPACATPRGSPSTRRPATSTSRTTASTDWSTGTSRSAPTS